MGVPHPNVAVQLPVLSQLGHNGPCTGHNIARATLPVQRSCCAVSNGVYAGYRRRASGYGTTI